MTAATRLITRDEAAALNAVYDEVTVRETWQQGDLMLVDNILCAHGREAFQGNRKIVVAMGAEALEALNELEVPLGQTVQARIGEVQELTPSIDALYVPNIDESLDERDAKREFWEAFRALGEWWAAQPPY